MAASVLNKIEYIVLLVAAFASRSNVTEAQAYRYLSQYGALALCDKHYGIMRQALWHHAHALARREHRYSSGLLPAERRQTVNVSQAECNATLCTFSYHNCGTPCKHGVLVYPLLRDSKKLSIRIPYSFASIPNNRSTSRYFL